MDATAFLAELEALTHSARQRRMLDLGRASLADAAAKALVDALAVSEDAYARTLVVCSLYGSRDGELALRLFEDPSRIVRRRAARAIPVVCDDARATQALPRADTSRSRSNLAIALRRRRRLAPLDAFFDASSGALGEDRALLDALPFASDAAVLAAALRRGQDGAHVLPRSPRRR